MRTGHLLFSAVHLFMVLLILAFGVFFLVLQGSSVMRLRLEELLVGQGAFFTNIGVALLIIGGLLLFGLYQLNRQHYLTLKMSGSKVLIDEAIVRDYLRQYWKETFPHQEISSEVVMHLPQKLEIIVDLPQMKEEEKEHLLSRMENELGVLLARKLGYEKEFFLTINA